MRNIEANIQNKIYKLLQENGFEIKSLPETADNFEVIQINQDKILDIVSFLKNNELCLFNILFSVSGMDYGESLGVVYHLYSTSNNYNLTLKVVLDKQNTQVQSLSEIYNAANWHERETFDLFGINFINHPNLTRILLPESWQGHPLRKDYEMNDTRLSWNAR